MSKLDELIQEYCPEGVEYRSLVSLCKIETGKLNANAAVENGPYLFFTTAKEISRIDKYRWDTEALLIAGNANVGDVKHYEGKFDAYQRTYVLNSFDKSISVRFLYFFVSSALKSYLENRTNSAAMTYIVLSTLQDFKVPIPPLEVQKEIVNILDKFTLLQAELSSELDARRKQYEYYREELMTFGNDVERKLLGEVGEVTKLAGYEFTAHIKYANEGNIIALRGLNVKNGRLDLSSVKYIDQSNFAKLSRSKLYVDDMLFTYVGTIGQVALIDENDKYYLAPNVARIRFTDKNVNPVFMRYYFQTRNFTNKQINRYLSESSMKNLTMENIRKFQVPIPSLSEQERIVKLLDEFNTLVGDESIGLPAELSARRQQYEYYRTKLLTFQELPA